MIMSVESKKVYIGRSIDISNRWRRHKWELRNNIHCNQHLQAAWNKYGEDKFIFSVVELCENIVERETHYIRHFESNDSNKGYNILSECDEVVNKNIRKKAVHKESNSKAIIGIQVDTGNEVYFDSFRDVSEALNISHNSIQECLSTWKGGNAKSIKWTAKGYILMYIENYNECIDYLDKYNKIMKESYERGRLARTKEKPIKVKKIRIGIGGKPIKAKRLIDGEEFMFESKLNMCNSLNLMISKVNMCLSDKYSNTQHRGFKFELL